jgi:hypothetical protein
MAKKKRSAAQLANDARMRKTGSKHATKSGTRKEKRPRSAAQLANDARLRGGRGPGGAVRTTRGKHAVAARRAELRGQRSSPQGELFGDGGWAAVAQEAQRRAVAGQPISIRVDGRTISVPAEVVKSRRFQVALQEAIRREVRDETRIRQAMTRQHLTPRMGPPGKAMSIPLLLRRHKLLELDIIKAIEAGGDFGDGLPLLAKSDTPELRRFLRS